MTRPELSQTLTALIEALDGSWVDGAPQVTEAEMTVPFEVILAEDNGGLRAFGAPPQSRFESGVMHPVHRIFIRAAREDLGGRE